MRKHSRLLKALIITTTACLTISSGRAEPEYTGILGYQTITLGPGYNFVGINFKNTTQDETFDIQTLFDTSKLHGGMSQLGSDQLFLWDADQQEYVQLWLFDSGGQSSDDGKWFEAATSDFADRDVSLGDGFWFIRSADEFVDVTVTGAVESAASTTHVSVSPGGNQSHSYNLFASAYPVDMPINEMDWSGFSGGISQGSSDQIFFWDAENQKYVQLWLFDSGGDSSDDGKWYNASTGAFADANDVIAAGQAIWTLKQDGTAIEEQKPF